MLICKLVIMTCLDNFTKVWWCEHFPFSPVCYYANHCFNWVTAKLVFCCSLLQIRFWPLDFPDHVIWFDLYGQQDTTIVIGVMDNSNYYASVQVMNYAGVGPIGEERLAETFHLRKFSTFIVFCMECWFLHV